MSLMVKLCHALCWKHDSSSPESCRIAALQRVDVVGQKRTTAHDGPAVSERKVAAIMGRKLTAAF
jgi:hypothetical protein